MRFWTLPTTKKVLFELVLLLGIALFNSLSARATNPAGKYIFIENKGQWPSEILYMADIPGGYLHVKKDGLQYLFYDSKAMAEMHFQKKGNEKSRLRPEDIKAHVVAINFQSANKLSKSKGGKKSQGTFNFFYGNDPSKWIHGAMAYDEVFLENIYDQIDFRLYSQGESLKYEFIAHPGSDPKNISMKYLGQDKLELKNGNLYFETTVNSFKEFKPYTFQENAQARKKINSEFDLQDNLVGFEIGQYDPSKDLIIDPELVFSTYSGSSSDNWSHTATYDDEGNLYAGGTVFGPSFPASPGVFQPESAGATNQQGFVATTDIVIMKYASDGSRLLYATFLGGVQSEVPHSMICNSKGDLVVFGTTSSNNFPVSSNAFQRRFNGGPRLTGEPITTGIGFAAGTDIFVSVIKSDGTALLGSTYVGGTSSDGIHDYRAFLIQNYGDEFRGEVYVDRDDHIYVASVSSSNDFPLVAETYKKSSSYDGVVFELSPDTQQLLWSTFLGGNRYDACYGVKVNDDKEVFVLGTTLSDNLEATANAHQRRLQGNSDAFIAKFKNKILQGLTYMGTAQEDIGSMIDLDNESNVYVFGLTQGDYPVNGTVYKNSKSGQFIHALNGNLSQTKFSTVIGTGNGVGTVDLVPTAFLVNDCGNIYLAGWGGRINSANGYNSSSTTTGLPITSNAYQNKTTGSNYYIAILEANAKSLIYATYFGSEAPSDPNNERGDHLDGGTCRFDKNGIIYHSACVCKTGNGFVKFPTDNGPQPSHNSNNCNMASFKFDIDNLEANFDIVDGDTRNPEVVCVGTKLLLENNSKGGNTYEWSNDNGVFSRREAPELVFDKPGKYQIKLEAFNNITCSKSDSSLRSIEVVSFEHQAFGDTTVCAGSEVILGAQGGESYEWSPSNLLDNPNIENPKATINETVTFSVKIFSDQCTATEEVTVTVEDNKEDFVLTNSKEICANSEQILRVQGEALYYIWQGEGLLDSTITELSITPAKNSTYKVTAVYEDGCRPSKFVNLTIDESFLPDFDFRYEYECAKPVQIVYENLNLKNVAYTWDMGDGTLIEGNTPANFKYKAPGQYMIKLLAKNDLGCELAILKPINVPDADGLIPNAISPNGDGKNDTFVPGMGNVGLKIFNRWGKLVYDNSEYDNSWGTGIKNDTYFYEIKLENGSTCKGWLEVFN